MSGFSTKASSGGLPEPSFFIFWGDALAGYLNERLLSRSLEDDERAELIQHLAQFAENAAIQGLLAQHVNPSAHGPSVTSRLIALEAMRSSALKELPPAWLDALTMTVAEGEPTLVPLAIGTVRSLPAKGATDQLKDALLRIASSHIFPATVRVEALAAIPEGVAHVREPG